MSIGCDFGRDDIPIAKPVTAADEDAGARSAGAPPEGAAGSGAREPSDQPDDVPAMMRPMHMDAGFENLQPRTTPIGDDGMDATVPLPIETMDPMPDRDDAQLSPCDELDAGCMDATVPEPEPPGPVLMDGALACMDGTLVCIDYLLAVTTSWTKGLSGATVTLTTEQFRFDAVSDANGFAVVPLPLDQLVWAHAEHDGHRPTDAPILVSSDTLGLVLMFSEQYITEFLEPGGYEADRDKGIVVEWVEPFAAPTVGAGLDIGKQSLGPFTMVNGVVVERNVVDQGSNGSIVFFSVEPGPMVPAWISPEGFDCSPPFDTQYRNVAGSVLAIPMWCRALANYEDAGL